MKIKKILMTVYICSAICSFNIYNTSENEIAPPITSTIDSQICNANFDSEKESTNQLIIKVDNNVSKSELTNQLDYISNDWEQISGKFEIKQDLPDNVKNRLQKYLDSNNYSTILSISLKDEIEPKYAKQLLESNSIVESVDYDTTTDCIINETASYTNDTNVANQYYLEKIDVKKAWYAINGGGLGQSRVAVIDTGLYINNPDFNGRYLSDLSVDITSSSNSNYTKLKDISNPDSGNHGTHVCGLIAAKQNNNFQITGIASDNLNCLVNLIAIKASTNGQSFTLSNQLKAIQYAIENGADVINLSLGSDTYNTSYQDVINNAYNAGISVVAARGNNGSTQLHYPACYNNVISVSSLDEYDSLVESSSYGDEDICAPGKLIYSSSVSSNDIPTVKSGTSMATPMVSATIAMMKSAYYDLSPTEIESILKTTATDLGNSYLYGSGRLNTGYAVQMAKYRGLRADQIHLSYVAETSYGNAKVKWNHLDLAEGYSIYRSTSENGTYTKIGTTDGDYFIDTTVQSGKTYYYKVMGYIVYQAGSGTVNGQKVGYSRYSNIKNITIN